MSDRNTNWVGLKEFSQWVHSYCKQGYSGTLFGVTDANQSVVIVFTQGKIIEVIFKAQSGRAALIELINNVGQVRFRLVPNVLLRVNPDLPETDVILKILDATVGHDHQLLSVEQLVKSVIVEEACQLFGPVAGLLCQEVLITRGIPQDRVQLIEVSSRIAELAGRPTLGPQLAEQLFKAFDFGSVQSKGVDWH